MENTPDPELEEKVLQGFAEVLVKFIMEKEAENDAKGLERNPDLWKIEGGGHKAWRKKWEEKYSVG